MGLDIVTHIAQGDIRCEKSPLGLLPFCALLSCNLACIHSYCPVAMARIQFSLAFLSCRCSLACTYWWLACKAGHLITCLSYIHSSFRVGALPFYE